MIPSKILDHRVHIDGILLSMALDTNQAIDQIM